MNRKVIYKETFQSGNDFEAYHNAQSRLSDLGYIGGPMCGDEPIGFADGDVYHYIAKWRNLNSKDKELLDGIMVSNDFRNGSVEIHFFNAPKF